MIRRWLHTTELLIAILILIAAGTVALALAWAGLQWVGQWATWGIAW